MLRIQDVYPGSNNSNKRGGETIYCPTFFVATNITKLKIIFNMKGKENNFNEFTKN